MTIQEKDARITHLTSQYAECNTSLVKTRIDVKVEDERIAWLQSKVDILDGQLWAAISIAMADL
jgi:hypothetical protein